jgi:hypothetical protein
MTQPNEEQPINTEAMLLVMTLMMHVGSLLTGSLRKMIMKNMISHFIATSDDTDGTQQALQTLFLVPNGITVSPEILPERRVRVFLNGGNNNLNTKNLNVIFESEWGTVEKPEVRGVFRSYPHEGHPQSDYFNRTAVDILNYLDQGLLHPYPQANDIKLLNYEPAPPEPAKNALDLIHPIIAQVHRLTSDTNSAIGEHTAWSDSRYIFTTEVMMSEDKSKAELKFYYEHNGGKIYSWGRATIEVANNSLTVWRKGTSDDVGTRQYHLSGTDDIRPVDEMIDEIATGIFAHLSWTFKDQIVSKYK